MPISTEPTPERSLLARRHPRSNLAVKLAVLIAGQDTPNVIGSLKPPRAPQDLRRIPVNPTQQREPMSEAGPDAPARDPDATAT